MDKNSPNMVAGDLTGPRYWKSLDDLAETPAFKDWVEREFPQGASEIEGVNRRNFLKLMAASFGLAGLGMAGCRRPEQYIKPYAKQPERVIPGVPVFYSTALPGARDSVPLIVETHQARPTKIEGNPTFLPYGGATDGLTQASVLDLYDPDRMTASRSGGSRVDPSAVRDMLDKLAATYAGNGGEGLVFLAEPSASASRARLAKALKTTFPKAVWSEYAPLESEGREYALSELFGHPVRTLPKFEQAKCVLSIGADFAASGPNALAQARGFAKTRRVKNQADAKKMSRLYAVEADLTLTGAMADHRLRIGASQLPAFTALIGAAVLEQRKTGVTLTQKIKDAASDLEVDTKWLQECAKDLVAHGSKHEALVVAGDNLPKSVHLIVAALNKVLGAEGHTVAYLKLPEQVAPAGIAEVAEMLAADAVQTLVVLGGNPAYDAPAELDWARLQKRAGTSIHLTYHYNETAAAADTVIARSHYLESWGDARTFDGTLLPVQPMIEPLFPTFNELEVLARIAGASEVEPYKIARTTFAAVGGKDYDRFLSLGMLDGSAFAPASGSFGYADCAEYIEPGELEAPHLSAAHLEVVFAAGSQTYDGRYANNGWLMETPDPLTKLTWDNAILISPRLAKELAESQGIQFFPETGILTSEDSLFKGVKGEQQRNSAQFSRGQEVAPVAELTVAGRTIRGPVHVHPGLANYSVVLPLGFGRTQVGRVGKGTGFDAYAVRTSGSMACAVDATLKVTRETYRLANTQEHWSMEGRAIIREATANEFAKKPDFAQKMGIEAHAPANYGKDKDKSLQYKVTQQPRGYSAYETPKFTDPPRNVDVWKGHEDKFKAPQQWGMSIDLNTCMGCNACVVACTSENNIPVIGKDQVLRGREMHWIRLDRYFSSAENDNGDVPEDVQVSFMGMACQHCENAPCESVCPVNATVHDEQGLNVMAYNRCVGTRYCANNCPYKVRRFNFFDWNKRAIDEYYKGPFGPVEYNDLNKMQRNPNVTVRMRGVMEKCTYCVQRIEAAKIDQKRKARDSDNIYVPDGTIKTACQQACPTEAIVFGDLADADTEVSKAKDNDRDYAVLGYLNNRPRTTYLARLRNPNPAMPGTYTQPFSRKAYESRYGHGDDHGHGPDHHKAGDAHEAAAPHH